MPINDLLLLFESLVVVGDRESLVSEIDIIKNKIFSVNSVDELDTLLFESVSEARAREFSAFIRGVRNTNYDGHVIQEFLESLRESVIALDVATVYLAIELSRQDLLELRKKLSNKLNKYVIIDVRIEPSILGGIKLELGGKYLDLSLLNTLKKMTALA